MAGAIGYIIGILLVSSPVLIVIAVILKGQSRKKESTSLIQQGFMQDMRNRAFETALAGMEYKATDPNLNNIFNRLDKNILSTHEIYPQIDFSAGMIIFQTKYLTGAFLSYIGNRDGSEMFQFKIQGRGNFAGYEGSIPLQEIACNIILTTLEKAVK